MSELRWSCLCVTERRPEFMPWMLWAFESQTCGADARELVVVDSSPEPWRPPPSRSPIRVVHAPGANIPEKRNRALDEARGEFCAWFDDDDWQDRDRLGVLEDALQDGADVAGVNAAWFIDVETLRCRRYASRTPIFNSAGFRTRAARGVRFDPRRARASDAPWMQTILERARTSGTDAFIEIGPPPLSAWLCHGRNVSNPAQRRRCDRPLEEMVSELGRWTWGEDSDRELRALRARLGIAVREHAA